MADDQPQGGLQRERTRLAWRRTALSFAAVGALLVRDNLGRGVPAELPGIAVLCFAATVYLLGAARSRPRAAVDPEPTGGAHDEGGAPVAGVVPARAVAALAVTAAALSLLELLVR